LAGLELVPGLLSGLEWRVGRMRDAIAADLHATDRANELVGQGHPFREAYRQAAAEIDQLGRREPEESLRARISPGGCARLELAALQARLEGLLANPAK
jgi:argininosuccinate lyase